MAAALEFALMVDIASLLLSKEVSDKATPCPASYMTSAWNCWASDFAPPSVAYQFEPAPCQTNDVC